MPQRTGFIAVNTVNGHLDFKSVISSKEPIEELAGQLQARQSSCDFVCFPEW
jgi:hypothetical protein